MRREQSLVGGDDMLPTGNRGKDQFLRWLISTDQLGNDIDVGILENPCGIVRKQSRRDIDTTVAFEIAYGDSRDFDRHTDTMANQFRIFFKDAQCAGSDRSQTDESDIDLLFHLIA